MSDRLAVVGVSTLWSEVETVGAKVVRAKALVGGVTVM